MFAEFFACICAGEAARAWDRPDEAGETARGRAGETARNAGETNKRRFAGPGDFDVDAFSDAVSAAEVDGRFKRLRAIGDGAFGVVTVARDAVTGDVVAVKKMKAAIAETPFEVACLRYLRRHPHPHVMAMRGYWTALRPGGETPGHILFLYVEFDIMAQSLRDVIWARAGAFFEAGSRPSHPRYRQRHRALA